MDILRTPDERFDRVPSFDRPFRWFDDLSGYQGLRIACIDTGPTPSGEVFLCLHGEPTWSFLYRKMIDVFVAAGHRAVAPDLPGFGRSDKPVEDAVYTFDFHRGVLVALLERMDLRNVTLVCQDWGGLLGLTLPMEHVDRFTGLVVMNTMLGTGDAPLTRGFTDWRDYVARTPELDCAKLLGRTTPILSVEEAAAYEAPFPDARHKAGVRRFPQMVPDRADAPGAALSRLARDWWHTSWRGRTLMAIGMKDPVLGAPVMQALRQSIRGCPPPIELAEAGHFVPEWGAPVAQAALERWSAGGA
jgi:pimeloyl-ACP methyl ester carboxylesterase